MKSMKFTLVAVSSDQNVGSPSHVSGSYFRLFFFTGCLFERDISEAVVVIVVQTCVLFS